MDPGVPLSREGPRGDQSTEGCGNGHGGQKGRPVEPGAGAGRGSRGGLGVEPGAPRELSEA